MSTTPRLGGRGEVVAIIGGSGAGETTLLETLAGVRPPHRGRVRLDVSDAAARQRIGCVPQDDIIHLDLPLRRTVTYAARLRLPPSTSRAVIDEAVDRVLVELDLAERGEVRVRELSGGQRKRASIGLVASAVVSDAAQATLALPMLCFPQVLFAGATVPVDVMTSGGRAISEVMSNRWAFEALGRVLDLVGRFPAGQLGASEAAFQGDASVRIAASAVMIVACALVAVLTLHRRLTPRSTSSRARR